MAGIKRKIKNRINRYNLKGVKIEKIDGNIEVSFETVRFDVKRFILGTKEYAVRNNKVKFPYSKGRFNKLRNKNNKIVVEIGGRNVSFTVPKKLCNFAGEYVSIDQTRYSFCDDNIVSITSVKTAGADIILSYDKCFEEENDTVFLLTNSDTHKIIRSVSEEEGTACLKNALEEIREKRFQLDALCGDKMIPTVLCLGGETDARLHVYQENGNIYILDSEHQNYVFKAPGIFDAPGIKRIKPKGLNASFNSDNNRIEASVPKGFSAVFYWLNINKGIREEAVTVKEGNTYLIDHTARLAEERDYFKRDILKCEMKDSSGEIRDGFVILSGSKSRSISKHILDENAGNRLVNSFNGTVYIENSECELTYELKYKYDFTSGAFTTDIGNASIEGSKLSLDLKVASLLIPISSIVIYALDNYKKRTYYIDEILCEEPSTFFRERITFDISKLDSISYYNMRISFRIGIRYINNHQEEDFICCTHSIHNAQERFFYKTDADENDMVKALYLGENHYNLNLWYTSEEEYHKVVRYEEGKETYYRTVQSEPVDNHLILFEANLGKDYTGNPKYLYEYMISRPEFDHFTYVWTYPDTKNAPIPGKAIIVERGSSEYYYYFAKAKYKINNIRFPMLHKRSGTIYLNTWHGTPLKKLGFDIECEGPEKQAFGSLYKESRNWDYMTVDNDYGEEKLVGAFRFKGRVIKKGYPINDIYYDQDRLDRIEKRLRKDYPAIAGKQIILYAPTWRDLKGDYIRGYEFKLPFDLEYLYNKLSSDYVIMVKLHHLINDSLVIDEKYKDFIINVSNEEDVMELLCKTDILITDYSSVFYDYASACKPILFYMYDLEEYLNETRGTYVSVDTLPGPILKTDSELVDSILSIKDGSFGYSDRLKAFSEEFAKYCHGTSSRDVIETIIEEEDYK